MHTGSLDLRGSLTRGFERFGAGLWGPRATGGRRWSEVADYANLARLAHVSRARISQILNLLLHAPDVQKAILFLPAPTARTPP